MSARIAKVVNGIVVSEMTSVPDCIENVSGFNLLPVADQITHGYYPLTEIKAVFDAAIEKLNPTPVYTIGATMVTATYSKVALTPAELAAIAAAIPVPPTLAQVKAIALADIDNQAGATRLKYITDVAGQSETYLSKSSDAVAYKAASYPSANIANYPMVQAEAKAMYGAAPTAAQYQSAADGVIATQAQWMQLAAAIEQQRRAGKIAVSGSTTVAAVQAARQSAITALVAL